MTEIISKKEFLQNKKSYLKRLELGAIFIYPTDTIYGIGCICSNKKSIQKIRKIKQRTAKPFSIIVPTKNWIKKNCKYRKDLDKHLKKLPGKYTLILELKNKKLSPNKDLNTIGVRIPKHWISRIVKEINMPIITTSVNISNEPYMTSLKNINPKIKKEVALIIYEGQLNNKPSKVINLVTNRRIR